MKSLADLPRLRRRARLAHTLSLGGLLVLLGGVALSLYSPEQGLLVAGLLALGLALSAVGVFQANRWVRKPRPEVVLDQALASLSDRCRVYHYLPFCEHLLLTPSGLVVLETVNLDGRVTYRDGKWRRRTDLGRALRSVFEGRLGDPLDSARRSIQAVGDQLARHMPPGAAIPVTGVVVFTHPGITLDVEAAPLPVVVPKKLARAIQSKADRLPPERYQQIRAVLDRAAGESKGT